MKENLTQYEHVALVQEFNLADGHAHQHQTPGQKLIIKRLPEIFYEAASKNQRDLEGQFLDSFFKLAHQYGALNLGTSLCCLSASHAIQIAAQLLEAKRLRALLVEPTFDNLASILQRANVDLTALDERYLFPAPQIDYIASLGRDALFIVLPNNPTGRIIDEPSFRSLVNFCATTRTVLVVDFCFRFFDEKMLWDQYTIALNAGIDFIFIEDTGKTWPSLDLKTGIITVNPSLYDQTFRIHNDLMLNTSPFILELLRSYTENSDSLGIEKTVTGTAGTNRNYLREKVKTTILKPANLDASVSVEWLKILGEYDADEIWTILQDKGVFVLPGTHFYWKNPDLGKKYIRIALMRHPDMFRKAVDVLVNALPAWERREAVMNLHS